MSRKKNVFLDSLEYFLFVSFLKILEFVPVRMAYFIGATFGRVAFIVDRKHRKRTIQHLLHAGIAANPKEATTIAQRNFINLSYSLVETLKINPLINDQNIRDYLSLNCSEEAREKMFGENKITPVIALSAHYGNWELTGIIYGTLANHPIKSVMRPFDNPRIGDFIIKQRSRFQQTLCPKAGALKYLLGALKKNTSIGVLIDQHAGRKEGIETTFFGQPARTHVAPALLHLKTGAPIFVGVVRRINTSPKFELVLKDPIEMKPGPDKEHDIKELTQRITTAYEELIREQPDQWLWSHRRWLNINRKNQPIQEQQV